MTEPSEPNLASAPTAFADRDTRPDRAPIPLRPCEIVAGRYEVRALLGEGGMGAVFRVHDRELDEEVALKVLHSNLSADAVALERFRREVKLARRVTHPAVARTYDLGFDRLHFLTMELVSGEPVSALVRGGERPPLPEALRIAEEVTRGLSAAHAVGVVHRDLKPANVMRCPGQNGRIVITDFGIAALARGAGNAARSDTLDDDLRRTLGQVIGTPAYMAPEQVTGQPIDGRTDVYALGTLLFELLTGQLPFRRDGALATAAARLTEDAPDARELVPDIPEPVARLVAHALARRREDRPDAETTLQTIEQLRGAPCCDRRASCASTATLAQALAAGQAPPSVAVASVDARGDEVRAADDLAEALADGLARLGGLVVIPPSVMREQDAGGGSIGAARALGATWVLETSLREQAGRRRARVRLVALAENRQLWAAPPIDGSLDDGFAFEDRVVATAVDAVSDRLVHGARGPEDPQARDIYDRARALQRSRSVPDMRAATALLEQGIIRCPGDPWLLGLLGSTLIRLYSVTGARDHELASRGEELALRALAIDSSLPETYCAIGVLRSEQGAIQAAVRALAEGLARNPALAEAHVGMGILSAETGRVEEALSRFDAALRIDPGLLYAWAERARVRALLGDRAGAEQDVAHAIAIGGPNVGYLQVRLVVWWRDHAQAAALADAFERSSSGAAWEAAAPLLRAFARGELLPETAQIFERLAADPALAPRNGCRIIEIAAEFFGAMGQQELALRALEQAATLPFVNILWLDRCICLDELRADPRFAKVRGLVAARAADVWR